MEKKFWKNPVFSISAAVVVILVVEGAIIPVEFGNVAGSLFVSTTRVFVWFYLLALFIFVIFLVVLVVSKYVAIRMGVDE